MLFNYMNWLCQSVVIKGEGHCGETLPGVRGAEAPRGEAEGARRSARRNWSSPLIIQAHF